MDNKRSKGLTFLGYFLICIGTFGALLHSHIDLFFGVLGALSAVCGIGIVKRLKWANYATIIVFGTTIIYQCLWCSPVFHKERIAMAEAKYKRRTENTFGDKFQVNLNGPLVSKSEYVAIESEKVQKVKETKYLFGWMVIKSILPLLIILYLSRRKIKEEFKKKPIT